MLVRMGRCFEMWWIWQIPFDATNMHHFRHFTDTYKSPQSKRTWPSTRHTRNPGIYIVALSWNSRKTQFQVLLPLETPCFWHTLAHCTMAKSWESKGTRIPPPQNLLKGLYYMNHKWFGKVGTLIKIPMMKSPRSAGAFSFTFAFMAFALSIAIALDSFTTLSTWTPKTPAKRLGDHRWRPGERDPFLP